MTRYWMLVWFIIGITVGLFISTGAYGQQSTICRPRNTIIEKVGTVYNEVPTHIALAAGGKVVEVLVSPTGTWTMLVTDTNGMSCVMAVGEAWENVVIKKGYGT